MSRIKTVSPKETIVSKELQNVYKKLGSAANAHILQLQSLHPQAMLDHYNLYLTLMFKSSPLSRKFREMIAVSVSRWNSCDY
ncbi:peroxidase [Candidatus Uabimicrobium sp. HlEnr_7]|uniref:peroxidase n=1 Tax=Candidatus Uabimicrobium helgolandensis TaxID=3095367 RepID=UPI0035577DA3